MFTWLILIFEWWERSAHWSVIETDFEDGSMVVLFMRWRLPFRQARLALGGVWLRSDLETAFLAGSACS
ncbi:hypothetical protein HQN90_25410 [Paenibacillus alba]|uniref:hypothetical protein n=1 Tax=Paenibacillus alba TaxID=1197127 RepID=UPI0015644128|nr:hypothetical protein [Paenibacillus alba]NQX69474.1 hypothetical protein [Paenibacillus alba]